MSSGFAFSQLLPLLHFFMGMVLPGFVLACGIQLRGLMPGRVVLSFYAWAATAMFAHIPYLIISIRARSGAHGDEMAIWSSLSSFVWFMVTVASIWLGLSLLSVIRRLRNLAMLDPGGPMDHEG